MQRKPKKVQNGHKIPILLKLYLKFMVNQGVNLQLINHRLPLVDVTHSKGKGRLLIRNDS